MTKIYIKYLLTHIILIYEEMIKLKVILPLVPSKNILLSRKTLVPSCDFMYLFIYLFIFTYLIIELFSLFHYIMKYIMFLFTVEIGTST